MKKSSFLTIATIAISAATMPTMSMMPLTATEKPIYTFTIPWTKTDEQPSFELGSDKFIKDNLLAYTLLGFDCSDSSHIVDIDHQKVRFQANNYPEINASKSLLNINNITNETNVLNTFNKKRCDFFQFPSQFPVDILARLERGETIRHDNQNCIIILKLDKTAPAEKDNPLLKQKSDKHLSKDQQAEILPEKNGKKAASSNINNYIYAYGGISVIGIAGLIAYLIYFHQNNQLGNKLSQITDFIRNFRSNKI